MYRRILIALEGKETDEAVVAHVQRLAAQMNAEVIMLRVITLADDDDPTGLARQWQLEVGSSGWRRKSQAETCLSRLERRLRQEGLRVESALVIGSRSEADEIVSYAAENNCDLIAMASDSRPWYRRWISGSSASDVQRKATVPALFISDGTRTAPVARTAPKANTMMAIFGSNPCL
jgi:nucleotide-binding universal stress UspA family protein